MHFRSPVSDDALGNGLSPGNARPASCIPSLEQRLAVRERPSMHIAMHHSWRELLFLHWRVQADIVQSTLPPGLTVDTFEGDAWVGLVPFFMRSIRPWWLPSIPGVFDFQELNCRTYVLDRSGTPGVWFFSLDANSRLAVWGARTFYHLPYYHARMSHHWDRRAGRVEFVSHRRGAAKNLASRFVYEPSGLPATSQPGSLEFFLIERYVLFAERGDGCLLRSIVHHPPYQVSAASVECFSETLLELNGLPRTRRNPDHALVSRGVDVEVFPLQAAGERTP